MERRQASNPPRRSEPLRQEGVLVIGSGNLVHNLRHADFGLCVLGSISMTSLVVG